MSYHCCHSFCLYISIYIYKHTHIYEDIWLNILLQLLFHTYSYLIWWWIGKIERLILSLLTPSQVLFPFIWIWVSALNHLPWSVNLFNIFCKAFYYHHCFRHSFHSFLFLLSEFLFSMCYTFLSVVPQFRIFSLSVLFLSLVLFLIAFQFQWFLLRYLKLRKSFLTYILFINNAMKGTFISFKKFFFFSSPSFFLSELVPRNCELHTHFWVFLPSS